MSESWCFPKWHPPMALPRWLTRLQDACDRVVAGLTPREREILMGSEWTDKELSGRPEVVVTRSGERYTYRGGLFIPLPPLRRRSVTFAPVKP